MSTASPPSSAMVISGAEVEHPINNQNDVISHGEFDLKMLIDAGRFPRLITMAREINGFKVFT
jgi:hypothetical protein